MAYDIRLLRQLNDAGKAEDCLKQLLNDIYEKNDIQEGDPKPILYGRVTHPDNIEGFIITPVFYYARHHQGGAARLKNPYRYNQEDLGVCASYDIPCIRDGSWVAFRVTPDNLLRGLNSSFQLELTPENCIIIGDKREKTDVRLEEPWSYETILNRIIDSMPEPEYKGKLIAVLKREATRYFSDELKQKSNELEQISEDLKKLQERHAIAKEEYIQYRARREELKEELLGLKTELDAVHARHRNLFGDRSDYGHKVDDPDTLKTIGERLRYRYPPHLVAGFLMALTTSQIIALCGKPGTGKTTFAEQMANALGARFHLIEVQNNWTDRSDLLGFYNPVQQTYQSTEFLDALLEAWEDWRKREKDSRLHIICLDEMNLSRVEYYFATFLSLLQRKPEDRIISLLPRDQVQRVKDAESDDKAANSLALYLDLFIPPNVRFVGTMNVDDTTQPLSPKVIDRCIFLEFRSNKDAKDAAKDAASADGVGFYYPAGLFAEVWETSGAKDVVAGLRDAIDPIPPNPRLLKYVNCMWPMYAWLNGLKEGEGADIRDDARKKCVGKYIDLVLLTKVLPGVHFKSELPKPSGDDTLTAQRMNENHGDKTIRYIEESWSFFE